ncbi:hypothetical protein C1645_819036 [Glomus cerebriforme]|uniref:Uncharacterized protein n=1 Tax=Glomus cerebriforme TaxID=658196 RepID=A0A397T8T4_9GLOM|nr:hypothetical protein C1645_819036 [Glomus cerebriforme]
MSNNSTLNLQPTNCGVRNNCDSSQVCFAASEGPICDNINSNNTTYKWRLNFTVFPPLEYIGNIVGRKQKDQCEMFIDNSWSEENKNWLLSFFYQYWNSNSTISLPLGSFVRPLDYIGSCSNIIETPEGIPLQQLYCDYDNKCKKKIKTLTKSCYSSNQCLSQLCGYMDARLPIDGNNQTIGTCVSDGFVAYGLLKGNRAFNVNPVDNFSDNNNNNNNNNNSNSTDGNNDSNNKNSGMAVIIIILVVLFSSMAIYAYARRIFKKRDNNDDDTRYLRREIDPVTGEIITINTLSGRVRRGASILLNRGNLNRSDSIRTLPPYTVMEEDHPNPTSNGNGIVNSITQFFFPPGELPPPYEENENNNSNNTIHDVTLEEVREGVTIEGSDDNSTPPSRRSSLRSTISRRGSRGDDNENSPPRESDIIPEVIVDNSEVDKVEEEKVEEEEKVIEEEKVEEEEEIKEEEKEGEREEEIKVEIEMEKEGETEKEETETEKEKEGEGTVITVLSDNPP